MTVQTFSMDAELAPFMRGEVLIFDMRLVRPKMRISVDESGAVDWTVRPSTPFDPAQIALEKVTVTEGQIVVAHAASGREHLLSEINAEISARTLAGPWRADGSLRFDGVRTAIALATGRVEESGSIRVRLRADPEVHPVTIETDGGIELKDGAPVYAGSFKLAARSTAAGDPRQDAAGSAAPAGERTPPAYRVSGTFALDDDGLDVDAFRLETGAVDDPYTAEGSARLDLGATPSFRITASGAQVRFDERIGEAASGEGLTLEQRIAALERALLELPNPTIPGVVEVKLPAIVAGDTTFRDVALSATPTEGGWNVGSFSALLPGRTTLEGNGMLSTGDEVGFRGEMLLAVGQPSGFAAWLSKDVDEAIRRLPSAGFSGKVELTRKRQAFSDLELILGAARFRGGFERSVNAAGVPAAALELEGGALDVGGLAAFASLFVGDRGATPLARQDLDLKLKAGPVSAGGLTAQNVDTALRVRDGRIEIDRLAIAGVEGATISATGTVRDFATNPAGDLDAALLGEDLAPLIGVLAERYPDNPLIAALQKRAQAYPGIFADTHVDLVASAVPDDGRAGIAISATGRTGGSEISLTASGSALPLFDADGPLSVTFSARNDNAEALLALYGLPALPLGMTGGADTALMLRGSLSKGLEASLDFTSESLTSSYRGTVRRGAEGAEGEGRLVLDAADIEPWLMTTGVSIPGMGFGTPVSMAADAAFGGHVLSLSNIEGVVDEDKVSGDINAALEGGVPALTGGLSLDTLDLWPVVAMVMGPSALETSEGPWPATPFEPKPALPFTAQLDIAAGTVAAGPFGVGEDVSLSGTLDDNGLRIANIRANLHGGVLKGLAELKNNDGTGLISAQLGIDEAQVSRLLPGAGVEGRADISATVSGSGKSVEGLVASLSGSGTAQFDGLLVEGLDPGALPAVIARADAIGRDLDAVRTAEFAVPLIGKGTFEAESGEVAFTIANGILRAPPVRLQNPAASVAADLRADLNTGVVAASGEIDFVAGDEALAGSEPAVRFAAEGPPDAIERSFDTAPLAQFLTQRALEIEQARVEAMQAALLEKQRLRREVRYYAALQDERQKADEARRQAEEAARLQAEEEARIRAEAEAKAAAESEARRKAEEADRLKAEEAARRAAEAKAAAQEKAAARAEEKRRADERKAEAARQAEEARKAEAERKRREAEAAKPRPEIERVPLPSDPAVAPRKGGSAGRAFDAESIDRLLETLRTE